MPASERKQAVLDAAQAHVCPRRVGFWQEAGTPLVLGRRDGDFIWDLDGHRLYDLHLNGGTFNLGHRNPEVIAALVAATEQLDVGNHHFPSPERTALAETLAHCTPGDLRYAVFTPSASEAVDVALRSARRATGRRRVVSLEHGFHGRAGLSSMAGDDSDAAFFLSDQPEHFVRVPFADLDAIERALAGDDVAAVVLESIPATWGFAMPPEGYLAEVARLAREHGALYIADEVQTGLGRTGRLWAVDGYGVEPDVLITGKGLSGGIYPMAAAVLNERAGAWLHEHGWAYVTTFGGSELGCRVASKVLEIVTRPDVVRNVARLSEALTEKLAAVQREDDWLVEIRQNGLVIGLKFDHRSGGIYMQRELYGLGVWAIASGFDQSVLQFKPNLLMDVERLDDVLERLVSAMRVAREHDYAVPVRRPRSTAGA